MAERKINVKGETCPVPLVETRKAVRTAEQGDVLIIQGDHPPSKKEIPMAVDALGLELLGIEEDGKNWTIKIKITTEV
ncbi:MAG: sulfurtransferase TusA family protein [Thermoplasmatota archaeon]